MHQIALSWQQKQMEMRLVLMQLLVLVVLAVLQHCCWV
jgi:hypothetical protein